MHKKFLFGIFTLLILVTVLFVLPVSAVTVTEGSCGDNVTWSFDTETGKLEITGAGAMTDFTSYTGTPWHSIRSKIKSIAVGEGVTSIGAYSFYDCSSLEEIALPESLTSIGKAAFCNDKALLHLDLPSNIATIGDSAFSDCIGLTTLEFPAKLTSIGTYSFARCGVIDLIIPDTLSTVSESAFSGCPNLKSVTLPDNMTVIPKRCFSGCSALSTVKFPASLLTVGSDAFMDCTSFKTLKLPNGVKTVGSQAFAGSGVSYVVLPKSVVTIEASAFIDCTSLAFLTLGNGLRLVEGFAFYNCPKLVNVWFHGTETEWGYVTVDSTQATGGVPSNYALINNVQKVGCAYSIYTDLDDNHSKACDCGNYELEDHSFGWGVSVDDNQHQLKCNCGQTKLEDHNISEWTKHSDSEHKKSCSKCSYVIYDNHKYDDGVVTLEPTHTTTGKKTYTCNDCGHSYYEVISRLVDDHSYNHRYAQYTNFQHKVYCACGIYEYEDHRYGEGVITREPTHTQVGIKAFTCLDCGWIYEEGMNSLPDHIYGDWEKDTAEQHKQTCICGTLLTEPHSWDEGEIISEATHLTEGSAFFTCTECGETKTDVLEKLTEHTYDTVEKLSAEQHKKICDCGDVQNEDHHWDVGEVTVPSTHMTKGERIFTCKDCGEKRTEEIEKLSEHEFGSWEKYTAAQHKRICICGHVETKDHSWNDGEETTVPTHMTKGENTFTCEDCGEKRTEEIEKLSAHEFGSWEKHTATQHKRVCICGQVETKDHSWDNGKVTTAPTHMTKGENTFTCEDCGEKRVEDIAPKVDDHVYGNWTKRDDEYHEKKCVCGRVESEARHVWDEGKINKEPTHTDKGEKLFTCIDCGATRSEEIQKVAEHDWSAWQSKDSDKHSRTCVCGEEQVESHKWKEQADENGKKKQYCEICEAEKPISGGESTDNENNNGDTGSKDGSSTSGCSSTLSGSVGVLLLVISAAVMSLKKKTDSD